jgi:biofilm PGA synthesis lipoprotein PgaB
MGKKTVKFLFLISSVFFISIEQNLYLLASENNFIVLTYHDVVENRNELTNDAVTVDHLVGHFEWLKLNGYHVVSLDDLKAARDGAKSLPENAVLLSWDDGYANFYTHALPLLKAYNYPAVLAIVGSWMEVESGGFVQYGNTVVPRDKFMSWEQVKEAKESGLVEIVSHSYDLHKGAVANFFGDQIPAAVAQLFDFQTGRQETDEQYRERIRNDMRMSSDQIYQHLGVRPRAIVWPYGYYNMESVAIAAEFGMDITMSLSPVPARAGQLQEISRAYLTQNPDIKLFRSYLKEKHRAAPKHFFRVDSKKLLENDQDYFRATCIPCRNIEKEKISFWYSKYSIDRNKKNSLYKEKNFSSFVKRIGVLDPSLVIIDPIVFIDKKIEALFTNKRFPVVQNRLERICWHTQKSLGTDIFLWISEDLFFQQKGENVNIVNNFFSDMGKSSPVRGVIVDNPVLLSELLLDSENILKHQDIEFGDWNPAQRRAARQHMIKHGSKQQAELLQPLESFQHWQPFLEVSYVISAKRFTEMDLKDFFSLLKLFDFLIIDTGHENIASFKKKAGRQIETLRENRILNEISFLLSVDNKNEDISEELRQLPEIGIASWGYQFDDFHHNFPSDHDVHYFISKKSFPYPLIR